MNNNNTKLLCLLAAGVIPSLAQAQDFYEDVVFATGQSGIVLSNPGSATGSMHSFTSPVKSAPQLRRPTTPTDSGSTSGQSAQSDNSKVTLDDTSKVTLDEYVQSPVSWNIAAGYQSKYVRSGLDRFAFTNLAARESKDPGMYYAGLQMGWNNWSFGYKYITSDEKINPLNHPLNDEEVRYEEHIWDVNYSRVFGPDESLKGTIGYSGTFYPEEDFWGADMENEYYLKFAWSQSQYFQPSVKYSYIDQSDPATTGVFLPGLRLLERQEIVARVDGALNPVQIGRIPVGIQYYAEVGFREWEISSDDTPRFDDSEDWGKAWWQVGLALPIAVTDSFIVNPTVHYTDSDFDLEAANPEFWYGVSASYSF